MKQMKVQWKEIDGERWFKFNNDFDRFKYIYGHLLGIALLLFLIGLTISFYFVVYQHKDAYINPFTYGAERMEEINNKQVTCDCLVGFKKFYFNSTSFWFDKPSKVKVNTGAWNDPDLFANLSSMLG